MQRVMELINAVAALLFAALVFGTFIGVLVGSAISAFNYMVY